MAVTSLTKVVNSSFLLRFAGLASSGSSNSLSNSSSTTLSSGLRFGAQTFGQAVQGLNAGITFLNVTRGSLEELTKVTDKLIALTEKATKVSTSSDSRKNLNLEFKRITGEFRKIVDSGKFGNRDVLDLNDMSELFTTIGLDKESSDSIAKIFQQFSVPESDPDSMASEKVKGKRPYFLPRAAYTNPTSDTKYYLEKISDGPMVAGGMSTVNNVYTATDDILNQNSGHVAVFTQNSSGSLTSMLAGTLTADVSLKAVNETTGYSVIVSADDLVSGYNGAGVNQLFLVDATGKAVHQFTDEGTNVTFGDVSIKNDNLTVAFSRLTGTDLTVHTITSSVVGENPTAATDTTLETLAVADTVRDLQINNDGSFVGYIKTVGGVDIMQLRDTATNTADAFLQGETDLVKSFGFYDSDKIAIKYGYGPDFDIALYTDGSAAYSTLKINVDISTFKVLQLTTGSAGYVGYYDTVAQQVSLYSTADGTTPVASHSLGVGDTFSSLALAFNSAGNAEAMIGGQLPSYSGDSDLEFYRLKSNPAGSAGKTLAKSTAEYEEIFDGTLDISTRPKAYRMLNDLKGLRKELQDNIEGVNYATDIILKNIDLVRAAGFAFLNLSSSISSADEADKVAGLIRDEIRRNAPAALSQAGNLQNIAVAALALSEDSILGK